MESRMIGRVFLCKASRKAPAGVRAFVATIVKSKAPVPPTTSASVHGVFRSNAEQQIAKIPVIEVKGNNAVCDGGGGALGHPIEYIQLNTLSKEPQVCKYCGLRYIKASGNHGH